VIRKSVTTNKNKSSSLSPSNLRGDAALVLFEILESGKSARESLPAMQAHHKDQDKAWLQEMAFGVLRQLPLLQFWLRQLLESPLKGKNKIAEHLLLLGMYQLVFTRVGQHAAVSETVNACRSLKIEGMKGLVNAVLRNFIRQEMALNKPDDAQILSGLPKWLYKKLLLAYPSQLQDILPEMELKAPLWLRVNRKKITFEAFIDELVQSNITHSFSEQHPDAVILPKYGDITALPGFTQGWFAVQDGAAQLAATYLDAQTGEHILDCCAAPGGKTSHLLELTNNIHLTALDIDDKRLARISENLERLGHQANLICGDASQPENWWDGQHFDRILLDAPCSATGIIRRHPDIKWLRKADDIKVLVQIQAAIFDAMWLLLKPGGVLLYATCSILPEENVQQVSAFLARTADARLDPDFNHDPISAGRQILPGQQQMDGFYYCRLLKSDVIND
jgi:16S rRNA (cytosine967-C5)-methyltransferase